MPARVTAVLVALLTVLAVLPGGPAHAAPDSVRVAGAAGAQHLVVDGRPWTVRGVTWGPPQSEARRWLPDVAATGANTVRTWGVGHEVMFEQGARGGASAAQQRAAYARFVEALAQAVHRADPSHPVLSVEALPRDWRALARRAPHLDVIGVNAYASVSIVDRVFREARIRRPYLVTETGPIGSWEEAPDPAGGPADHGDAARAAQVARAIRVATAHPGRSLGVVVFHYGTEADVSGVRFGLRTLGLRRAAWFAVQRAFRGRTTQSAPVITTAEALTPVVSAGSAVRLRVAATDAEGDRVRWRALRTVAPWGAGERLERAAVQQVAPGVLQVRAPTSAGVHRIVVVAADGHGDAGMRTVVVRVRAAA